MAIVTLEETLEAQKTLALLCADRPLHTKEIFMFNAFYGIDLVVKQYVKFPANYTLKTAYQHTPWFSNTLWDSLTTSLPLVFAYTEDNKKLLIAANQKTYHAKKIFLLSAFPFLYVLKLVKDLPKPTRKGTLFFPAHSSHHVNVSMDFDALAEQLLSLDEQYQPVTVCMFWKDINANYHYPFQKRGIPIVSAGHMYDPAFYFRLYHLCSLHQYASGNSLGTHMFCSIKSGCSYFHISGVEVSFHAPPQVLKRDVPPPPDYDRVQLEALFSSRNPSNTEEQKKIVDMYLGTQYLSTPHKLRLQLLLAEILYRGANTSFRIRRALFHKHSGTTGNENL